MLTCKFLPPLTKLLYLGENEVGKHSLLKARVLYDPMNDVDVATRPLVNAEKGCFEDNLGNTKLSPGVARLVIAARLVNDDGLTRSLIGSRVSEQ
mmetsp:Transcript_25201/g.48186  ORF Transcript_25201/g.48186 Transcript_25201/m.48186 type:complete len:95 (-) Transcript_25201:50-334(-)